MPYRCLINDQKKTIILIDGIYIVRFDGICMYSYFVDKNNIKTIPDLMAPFFNALMMFSQTEMDGILKEMIFEDKSGDEKVIHFQEFKDTRSVEKEKYCIVLIFSKKRRLVDIKGKVIELKWLLEKKNVARFFKGRELPSQHEINEIDQQIKLLFNMD